MVINSKFFKVFFVLVLFFLIIFWVLFQKIDRTNYSKTPKYLAWKNQLSILSINDFSATGNMMVGYNKTNITPSWAVPLAGYGERLGEKYTSIHDSAYVRTLALKIGEKINYLVSVDLLIMPPNVTQKLNEILSKNGISLNQIHFSAIHSHNSLGGWGTGLAGRLFAGKFDSKFESFLIDKILTSIKSSETNMAITQMKYGEIVDSVDIRNRLNGVKGFVDPKIRSLFFNRIDGKTIELITYGAHSTCLNAETNKLSRDYPGYLVDNLEKNKISFAIFMAGAVGSMGPIEKGANDFEEASNEAKGVYNYVIETKFDNDFIAEKTKIVSYILPLPMNEPTPRISKNWALRPWLFRLLLGEYPLNVKVTQINNILMVGLPCDFSGELMVGLDKYAHSKGLHLIITSFNGGYAGYITDDSHFDQELYETTTMSWYGFQNGAYFSEVVRDIIDARAKN